MARSSLLSLGLCFLVLFQACVAQIELVTNEANRPPRQQRRQRSQQDECQLERIRAVEPSRRIQSEAGLTEIWDENDEQFQCAGVVAVRHTIQEKGLLLPLYVNGPKLIYVVQGRGVQGAVFPGCPETYQSSSESESQFSRGGGSQSQKDQHQKVRQIRGGDIIALPTGVTQWIYNNGRSPLVLVQIIDTSNPANQLDQNHRLFFLSGNPQQELQSQRGESQRRQRHRGESQRSQERNGNIFSGLNEQVLAEAFNINTDLAGRLKAENDNRGIIVSVEDELEMLRPRSGQEEEREEREEQEQRQFDRSRGGRYNGIEETFCTARMKLNLNNPSQADAYNPRAGRINTVNSLNLPILRFLRLSAQKNVLYNVRNLVY